MINYNGKVQDSRKTMILLRFDQISKLGTLMTICCLKYFARLIYRYIRGMKFYQKTKLQILLFCWQFADSYFQKQLLVKAVRFSKFQLALHFNLLFFYFLWYRNMIFLNHVISPSRIVQSFPKCFCFPYHIKLFFGQHIGCIQYMTMKMMVVIAK